MENNEKVRGKNERMNSRLGTFPFLLSPTCTIPCNPEGTTFLRGKLQQRFFFWFLEIRKSGKSTDKEFKNKLILYCNCATYYLCNPGQILTSIYLFSSIWECYHMPNMRIRWIFKRFKKENLKVDLEAVREKGKIWNDLFISFACFQRTNFFGSVYLPDYSGPYTSVQYIFLSLLPGQTFI